MDVIVPRKAVISRRMMAILVIVFVLVIALLVTWCTKDNGNAIRFETVRTGNVDLVLEAQAQSVPLNEVVMAASVSGKVTAVGYREGSIVNAGTVLLSLESPEAQANFRKAQKDYMNAEAAFRGFELDSADKHSSLELEMARSRALLRGAQEKYQAEGKLAESAIISKIELASSRSASDIAAAEDRYAETRLRNFNAMAAERMVNERRLLDMARDDRELARKALEGLAIKATKRGVVSKIGVKVGESVSAGQTVATLATERQILQVGVTSSDIPKMRIGQKVQFRNSNGAFDGVVSHIPNEGENDLVYVLANVVGDQPGWLRSDQAFEAKIELGSVKDAIYISAPAGARDYQSYPLYVVTENGDWAIRVEVKFELVDDNVATIVSGLHPGDRILLPTLTTNSNEKKIRL